MPDITPEELRRDARLIRHHECVADWRLLNRAADTIERQAARIAELEQQVAALREDAERYVELRDGDCRFAVADIGDIEEGCALVGGRLDVELDAARTKD